MAHLRDEWSARDLDDPRLRNGTFDDDHWLGPADAEITIIGYSSYTCPCSVLVEGLFDQIRRQGEGISLVHRHLFDPTRSPGALHAAILVEAAAVLGCFEPAHRWMLVHASQPGALIPAAVAAELGLDPWLYEQLANSGDIRRRVMRDLLGARHLGLSMSPSYLIAGEHYEGFWREADIEAAIETARERSARSRRPTLPLGPLPSRDQRTPDEEGAS